MAVRVFGTLDPFVEPGPILGRRVANEGFLRALFTADPFDQYHFFLAGQGGTQALGDFLAREFPSLSASGRVRTPHRLTLPRALAVGAYACFHQSDCITLPAHLARLRNAVARDIFPVTGVTHSLNYADYGQAFLKHLWSGTTARDAIVATSGPGAEVVERFFTHLRQGYGLSPDRFPAPVVRRIPLGLTLSAHPLPGDQERAGARKALGLDPACTALLVFGRIQHHSKMDLLPLFRAVQRLHRQGLPREAVTLILAGWTAEDDDLPETLGRLAANIGLPLKMVPRPSEERKRALFAASDLFVSIADNPQETFGLTLLEAGAMGLPVVASDYDGYRDILVPGQTGVLVPTLGPECSQEADLMAPLLFDNQYHLLLAQQTVVDVPALAQALDGLVRDPLERRRMGAAGRARVEAAFSWEGVLRQYLDLWEELRRAPVDPAGLRERPHPLHIPYARIFGGYPSARLTPGLVLTVSAAGESVYRQREFPPVYAGLADLVDEKVLRRLLFLARKPMNAGDLASELVLCATRDPEAAPMTRAAADFLILWALKQDYLERDQARPDPA